MGLLDVRGEKTLDLIAALIPPVTRIASDPAAAKLFDRETAGSRRLEQILPGLIREHKADLVEILAAVKDMPAREYAEGLTLPGLLEDLSALASDPAIGLLFP